MILASVLYNVKKKERRGANKNKRNQPNPELNRIRNKANEQGEWFHFNKQ